MNIHDGGEYSCEIEADEAEPISVVHTVEILGKTIFALRTDATALAKSGTLFPFSLRLQIDGASAFYGGHKTFGWR